MPSGSHGQHSGEVVITNQQPGPGVTARILHFALMASVLLLTGVVAVLRTQVAPAVEGGPWLLYAPVLVATVGFGAAIAIRSRLSPPGSGMSEDAWWQVNLGRALMVWTLIEGPSLIGIVGWLLTGVLAPLGVTGVGLVLFLATAPGRLTQA